MATSIDYQALSKRLLLAEEAGDCAAVAAIMRAHVTRADVQMACCALLYRIADVTEGAVSGCASAMEAVVAAMSKHEHDRNVQVAGCDVLYCLARPANDLPFTPAPVWEDAVRVVVAVLRAHRDDADMQAHGCSALASLCRPKEPSLRILAGRLGAVEHLLTSLRLYPTNAALQEKAMNALSFVIMEKEPASVAAHAGALDVIMAALHTHADNDCVQDEGYCTLSCLLKHVPALRIPAGQAGAVELLKTTLLMHADDDEMQTQVFQVLTHLLGTAETRAEARAAGLMEAAVGALQPSGGASRYTMMHACNALGITAKFDADFASCAGDMGAVEAVVCMLKARVNDEGYQESVLITLAHLVYRCPPNAVKALRAGALDAVFAGMRAHPAHVGIQTYGAKALAALQRCAAEAAAEAAAASLLAEEDAERAARLAPPSHKSKAKSKKIKQRGAGAGAVGGDEARPAAQSTAAAAHADATAAAADEPAAPSELEAAVPSAGEAPRSAAAERRRRRAAAKAASRRTPHAGGASAAGASGAGADIDTPDVADDVADAADASNVDAAAAAGAAAPPALPAVQADAPPEPPLQPPFLDLAALSLAAPPPPPAADEAAAQLQPPLAAPPAAPAPAPAPVPPPPVPPPPPPAMKECCVCLDDVAAETLRFLVPCGHRCVCADCAAALLAMPAEARRCPKCREPVLLTMTRVYE
jgi:hypothetical protein